jgi:hypothetical protein
VLAKCRGRLAPSAPVESLPDGSMLLSGNCAPIWSCIGLDGLVLRRQHGDRRVDDGVVERRLQRVRLLEEDGAVRASSCAPA